MTPRVPDKVLVVDGYAVTLRIDRGYLIVRDGAGDGRQERRISRVDPHLQRIVILGDTGTISLEAVRWCADLGISLIQVDRHGRTLLTTSALGRDDARLRRAQALAAATPVGVGVACGLLQAKLAGQAEVAAGSLGQPAVAQAIQDLAWALDNVQSIDELQALEATAAVEYFAAWTRSVRPEFATKDQSRIPEHWRTFPGRRPPRRGASRFAATDPVNALLNYLYALAATEARRACLILGLDPGLGFIHADKKARDSLALDLIEPVRPHVDAWLLDLLRVRSFTARDFHETRDGTCRVLAPLTHELAATVPAWGAAVAVHAEAVAHAIADASESPIGTPTPLTNRKRRAGATSAKKRPAIPGRTCPECGEPVAQRSKMCGPCWQAARPIKAARDGFGAAQHALAAARATGADPTHTDAARHRRAATTKDTMAADKAWDVAHPGPYLDPAEFRSTVVPMLAGIRLSAMAQGTGLSESACSLIRAGRQVPHPRHWAALAQLGHRALEVGTVGC